jgi:enamine deaminase RidA (YjgF/YER057c/UK114 family)
MLQNFHYSQAVRIPAGADRVEIAGQGKITHSPSTHTESPIKSNQPKTGGWNTTTSEIPSDLLEEIDQAFANVQLALQDAGVKEGWKGVFRVNSYHAGFEREEDRERVLERLVENLNKWCPGHAPIWTCVGVAALGLPGMRVEIEAVAVDGE